MAKFGSLKLNTAKAIERAEYDEALKNKYLRRANMKYIVVYGTPIDGFNFRGPFDTELLAHDYIDADDSDDTAWVVELTPPFEDE